MQILLAAASYPCPPHVPGKIAIRIEVQNPRSESNNAVWLTLAKSERFLFEADRFECRGQMSVAEAESRLSVVTGLCMLCGKYSRQRCSQCKQATYCSQACFKKDWKQHKVLCAGLCSKPF